MNAHSPHISLRRALRALQDSAIIFPWKTQSGANESLKKSITSSRYSAISQRQLQKTEKPLSPLSWQLICPEIHLLAKTERRVKNTFFYLLQTLNLISSISSNKVFLVFCLQQIIIFLFFFFLRKFNVKGNNSFKFDLFLCN